MHLCLELKGYTQPLIDQTWRKFACKRDTYLLLLMLTRVHVHRSRRDKRSEECLFYL